MFLLLFVLLGLLNRQNSSRGTSVQPNLNLLPLTYRFLFLVQKKKKSSSSKHLHFPLKWEGGGGFGVDDGETNTIEENRWWSMCRRKKDATGARGGQSYICSVFLFSVPLFWVHDTFNQPFTLARTRTHKMFLSLGLTRALNTDTHRHYCFTWPIFLLGINVSL